MKVEPDVQIELLPGVYEPAEDTFLILQALEPKAGERMLDVGSGTGIIAVHCAKAGAIVTACDIAPEAVECTTRNSLINGVKIDVVQCDLLERIDGEFDTIVFNPPYLPSDGVDDVTWTGGRTGVETVMELLGQARERLAPGGRIVTLVSSLGDLEGFEEGAERLGFQVRKLSESRLFFERLSVYELRTRAPS